jgi:ribose transport system ATP-binding protein
MTIQDAVAAKTNHLETLVCTGITQVFPGVVALDDVSLTVAGGEVHGIVGENGAGKSTLMAIVAGALHPTQGSVSVSGQLLESADPERARELGVAIVRQEPALMPDLTVAENLYLAMSPERRPSIHSMVGWAQQVLAVWGDALTVRPSDRVEELDPHQRFVVEICRALAQDPAVLILDEPTEHLLPEEVEVLFGQIRERRARGCSVVYISHRIPEVKSIADRITVLRSGRTEGTYDATLLSKDQIVKLIVGRELTMLFPDKRQPLEIEAPGLTLESFSARGLEKLSLELCSGEIVGLAGIEDNGQRVLLRALAGLENSSGHLRVGSTDIERPGQIDNARAGIAYLSGDRYREGVLTGLDVGTNVLFRSLPRLSKRGWVRRAAAEDTKLKVIADFNVKTPQLETSIESLSGGNQQKALMGAVLVNKPRIILIDEPTQGVDVGARSEIYSVLRRAADDGAVLVVVSSSAMELAGLADRVLVMSRGQVIRELRGSEITEEAITGAALTAETVRNREATRAGRIGRWLAGDAAPLALVGVLIGVLALVGAVANPLFLGALNISGILALAVPLALVAYGQLLVLLTGGIDLSTGPLMGLVVVIGSFYLVDGSPPGSQLSGWALILAVSIAVGLVNWMLIDVVELPPIVATLVTFMAVQALSFTLRPTPAGFISQSITSPMRTLVGAIPMAFIGAALIGVALDLWLKRVRGGIAMRAVGSHAESARVLGLNPRVVRLFAYVGCSALAGLAGIAFMAQIGTGDASAGVSYTLIGITAAVVGGASVFGGRGAFLGALLGAVMVQVVNSLTVFLHLTPDWQYYLVGAMTIGAVALYSTAREHAAASHS